MIGLKHWHNTLHTTDIMMISHVSLFDIMSTLDKDGLYHLHALSPEYPPLKLLWSWSHCHWSECLLSICVWCADCGGPGSTDNQLGCPGASQPARLGRHQLEQPGLASTGTTDCRPPSSPEGELETGEKWRMTKNIILMFRNCWCMQGISLMS